MLTVPGRHTSMELGVKASESVKPVLRALTHPRYEEHPASEQAYPQPKRIMALTAGRGGSEVRRVDQVPSLEIIVANKGEFKLWLLMLYLLTKRMCILRIIQNNHKQNERPLALLFH